MNGLDMSCQGPLPREGFGASVTNKHTFPFRVFLLEMSQNTLILVLYPLAAHFALMCL